MLSAVGRDRPAGRCDTTTKKDPRENTDAMSTEYPTKPGWSRRDMLRTSAAALMGGYAMGPRYGLAADIPMEYDGS